MPCPSSCVPSPTPRSSSATPPTANAGAITERLGALCDDEDLRHRFASAAREGILALYDWNVIAPQMLRVYREIVGDAPSPGPVSTPAPVPHPEATPEPEAIST